MLWEQRKISETNDIKDGTHDTPRYVKSGYPLITSKNLTLSNQIDFKNTSYITKKDFDLINKRSKVDVNDILFGMIGTIGNPVLVQKKIDFAIKNVALIKSSKNSNSYFLLSILNSNIFKKYAFKVNQGNTQRFISLSQIRNFTYFIPNISEQNKIAEMFKIVDNLITLYERKIKLLSQIKKYFLDNLFAENEYPNLRFKGFTNAWEQRNLLTVCYREDNKRKPVKRQDRKKGLTPYYGANGVQGYVSGYTHNGNYILIAEDGANDIKNYPISFVTGKIWANNHTHVLKINIKNNDGNFLVGTIKKINYSKYLVGSGRYKLTMESLSQINIWITSFPEQRKIGIVLNNINKLITLYESKLKQIKQIKKELLDTMFI